MSSQTTSDLVPTTTGDHETITYGAIHLDVVDAGRSLAFWRDLLGLAELSRSDEDVQLGAADRPLVVLHPGATRGALRGHAGLYHVAIHLPNEGEFARVLARLAVARVPQAPTDHIFSKATYLSDPDRIQLELTLETPERMAGIEIGPASIVIRDSDGRVRGMTEPLDVDEVLSHLSDGDLDRPLPSATRIGHVHLHVSDLEAAHRFYRDVIGFHEHTFVPGIGFADLGAGGRFPRRLAINVWQGEGAQQAPPGTAGLRHFGLVVEGDEALAAVTARLDGAGILYDLDGGTLSTHDPAGNALRVVALGQRSPCSTPSGYAGRSRLDDASTHHARDV